MQRYLSLAAAGEVRRLLQHDTDLPRHAETTVALLVFDRRADPSFEEGIVPVPTLFTPWMTALSRYAKFTPGAPAPPLRLGWRHGNDHRRKNPRKEVRHILRRAGPDRGCLSRSRDE